MKRERIWKRIRKRIKKGIRKMIRKMIRKRTRERIGGRGKYGSIGKMSFEDRLTLEWTDS